MVLKSVFLLIFVVFLSLSVAKPSLNHENSIRSKSNHLIENAKNGIDSNPTSKSYGKTTDEKRIQRWKRHFEFSMDADHEDIGIDLIALENRNSYKIKHAQLDRTARYAKHYTDSDSGKHGDALAGNTLHIFHI